MVYVLVCDPGIKPFFQKTFLVVQLCMCNILVMMMMTMIILNEQQCFIGYKIQTKRSFIHIKLLKTVALQISKETLFEAGKSNHEIKDNEN